MRKHGWGKGAGLPVGFGQGAARVLPGCAARVLPGSMWCWLQKAGSRFVRYTRLLMGGTWALILHYERACMREGADEAMHQRMQRNHAESHGPPIVHDVVAADGAGGGAGARQCHISPGCHVAPHEVALRSGRARGHLCTGPPIPKRAVAVLCGTIDPVGQRFFPLTAVAVLVRSRGTEGRSTPSLAISCTWHSPVAAVGTGSTCRGTGKGVGPPHQQRTPMRHL